MNTPTLEDLLRMVNDPNVDDDEVAEAARRWAESNIVDLQPHIEDVE